MKSIIACEKRPAVFPVDVFGLDFDMWSVICPICKRILDDDSYQFQDHVGNPTFLKGMFWCYDCEGHSRLVIDDYTDSVELTRDETLAAYPEAKDFPKELTVFYEVTFARIIKVVDSTVHNLYSKVDLPRESIAEVILAVRNSGSWSWEGQDPEVYNLPRQERKNMRDVILRKFGIKKEKYSSNVPEEYKFSLALPCNSYDVFHPSIAYPKGMELNHAGIDIYILCLSETTGIYYESLLSGD